MASEKPWLVLRIELESPTGEAVSVGPVIVQGMTSGKPLVVQVPIYGRTLLADGWPADREAFGDAVYRARIARGWSMVQLAKRAGVTEVTIRSIERGKSTAYPDTRERLIAVLEEPLPRSKPQEEEQES